MAAWQRPSSFATQLNRSELKYGCVQFHLKFFHPITSNVWYMHGVLNIDEKK
jgi:hypothetical protein